jgi:hypothetical protein
MYLSSLVTLCMVFLTAHAWTFTTFNDDNFCGKSRGYFSARGENNCYNLASEVEANVHSFTWCSMPWTRCSITMHSERGCSGKILGSATAAYPTIWEKKSVSAAGSKMRSFRVQGCFLAGHSLDVTNCYNGKAPWEKPRFCG